MATSSMSHKLLGSDPRKHAKRKVIMAATFGVLPAVGLLATLMFLFLAALPEWTEGPWVLQKSGELAWPDKLMQWDAMYRGTSLYVSAFVAIASFCTAIWFYTKLPIACVRRGLAIWFRSE